MSYNAQQEHPTSKKKKKEEAKRFWQRIEQTSSSSSSPAAAVDLKTTDNNGTVPPSLEECRACFVNEEAETYARRSSSILYRPFFMVSDAAASLAIYLAHTLTLETCIVVTNAAVAAYLYCRDYRRWSAKLDFSFLAFSVVFPLTFLIQTCFSRRDSALHSLADFKGAFLSSALMTLTTDWPPITTAADDDKEEAGGTSSGSGNRRGRAALPSNFSRLAADDYRHLLHLVYDYLSMPLVERNRDVVFGQCCGYYMPQKQVRALENGIVVNIHDCMFDMATHEEVMRKNGLPDGLASRLGQYHSYLHQRFDHLRVYKCYRTPQATRSFGRVYILLLPWIMGPYFAWVYEETNLDYAYTLILAGFTFLILLGLINIIRALEDPFVPNHGSDWIPGVDNIKLRYEFAAILQALEQYCRNADELRGRNNHGERTEV